MQETQVQSPGGGNGNPVFPPGESHGQRNLSSGGLKELGMTEQLSTHTCTAWRKGGTGVQELLGIVRALGRRTRSCLEWARPASPGSSSVRGQKWFDCSLGAVAIEHTLSFDLSGKWGASLPLEALVLGRGDWPRQKGGAWGMGRKPLNPHLTNS